MKKLKSRNIKHQFGFTLLEMVITVAIMGILAAIVTPTYLNTQTEAKVVMSKANVTQIQQAFINLYFEGVIKGEGSAWPEEPTDNKMTHTWAASTILYDGRTVAQLFSHSEIVYNPYDHPFQYTLLPATENEPAGFRIDDPDTGVSLSFRP